MVTWSTWSWGSFAIIAMFSTLRADQNKTKTENPSKNVLNAIENHAKCKLCKLQISPYYSDPKT